MSKGDDWTWNISGETEAAIGGEVNFSNSNAVRSSLKAFAKDTSGDLVLDLSELSYLDSSGLAVLIEMRRKLKEQGRALTIGRIDEQVAKIFKLTQVGSLFGI